MTPPLEISFSKVVGTYTGYVTSCKISTKDTICDSSTILTMTTLLKSENTISVKGQGSFHGEKIYTYKSNQAKQGHQAFYFTEGTNELTYFKQEDSICIIFDKNGERFLRFKGSK